MCKSGTCHGLQVTNQSSEIADDRPSAACEFSPDGSTLATGAWSGLLKLWSVPDCQKKLTIKAHDDRVTGKNICQLCYCKLVCWRPACQHGASALQLVLYVWWAQPSKVAGLFETCSSHC